MASTSHPYTCVACALAFASSDLQRAHYQSPLHQYNLRRKAAGLGSVSADAFEQVAARHAAESADAGPSRRATCAPCGKSFSSLAAYDAHCKSNKHQAAAARAESSPPKPSAPRSDVVMAEASSSKPDPRTLAAAEGDAEAIEALVAEHLDQAERLDPLACLFCHVHTADSLDESLEHMRLVHGLHVPDAEYVVDMPGLIAHLAEEIAVWNTCIFCGAGFGPGRSAKPEPEGVKPTRALEAVRQHMRDKGHCQIAWDTDAQRSELADFYDFRSSYDDGAGWEDTDDAVDDDEAGDAISVDGESDEDAPIPKSGIRVGDNEFELILPSGRRIGHRSLQTIYKQNLVPYGDADRATSRRRLTAQLVDPRSAADGALVPRNGGFGAFGRGNEVIRARNPGEARNANKATRNFLEVKRAEAQRTRVAIKVHNSQKHFRDPLLQ